MYFSWRLAWQRQRTLTCFVEGDFREKRDALAGISVIHIEAGMRIEVFGEVVSERYGEAKRGLTETTVSAAKHVVAPVIPIVKDKRSQCSNPKH